MKKHELLTYVPSVARIERNINSIDRKRDCGWAVCEPNQDGFVLRDAWGNLSIGQPSMKHTIALCVSKRIAARVVRYWLEQTGGEPCITLPVAKRV